LLLVLWALEDLSLEAFAKVGFLGRQRVVGVPDTDGLGPDRQAVVRGGPLGFCERPVEGGDGWGLARALTVRHQGLLEPVARKRARPVLRGPGRSDAPRLPDYWAADTLTELGAQVHLAHPLGVKMFSYRRVKNDQRDATDLADLLRMGRLPEAWIAPPATRELRGWVRHRAKLVGLCSSLKCQVHGVLAHAGIWCR
jgi:hypothetical protein